MPIPSVWSGVNGCLSSTFTMESGVLQGSVLSLVLFLLVMDPLLRGLKANHLGHSLCEVYVGAFAHADDIRTITSNLSILQQQVQFVHADIMYGKCSDTQSVKV